MRGSLFAQQDSVWLAARLKRRLSLLRGRALPATRAALEVTLGCSRELQDLLIEALREGDPLGAKQSHGLGQPTVALTLPSLDSRLTLEISRHRHTLHLPTLKEERLTLYVAARTSQPLIAVAVGNGRRISARLSLVALTPAALARVRLRRLARQLEGR